MYIEKIENMENHGSPDGTGATQKNNSLKEEKEQQQTEIHSFAEIWTEKEFEDTELLTDYLDTELVINSFEAGEGKYGPYAILAATVNGTDKQLRTSSKVVFDQINRISDRLPVTAKAIEKGGSNGRKYITLS